jgi:transcriptional regulator with XRE-family HTH domain
MSLRALAAKAGLSVGMVSQVERGITEPSLDTMRKIARVLDVPLFSLFNSEDHEVEITRADSRITIGSPNGEIVYSRLSPSSGMLELLEGRLRAHGRSAQEPHTHPAHECVSVTEGCLTVHVEGRAYTLMAGDSCYFDSNQPHYYENATDSPAVFLLAVSPPSF